MQTYSFDSDSNFDGNKVYDVQFKFNRENSLKYMGESNLYEYRGQGMES